MAQVSIHDVGLAATNPAGTHVIDDSLETLSELYEYNHWIFSLLRPHLGRRILEVGCGTGNITAFLAMAGRRVVGIDPVGGFLDRFRDRLGHMSHVSFRQAFLQDMPEPPTASAAFDSVVSCNVLEHIEDDVAALAAMARQIRPGGTVIVFVPAGRFAFGRLDRELGHYRRYTLGTLRGAMARAGLVWETGRYSNLIGAAGWWFNSVVLRRRRVPVGQASAFNRLVPIISAVERILPLPLGQSVIGVGRRPHAAALAQPVPAPRSAA